MEAIDNQKLQSQEANHITAVDITKLALPSAKKVIVILYAWVD